MQYENECEVRYLERVKFNLRLVLLSLAAVLLLAIISGGFYLWSINNQYNKARDQADVVRAQLDSQQGTPALGDLPALTAELNQLEDDLRELDDRVDLPIIGGIALNTPYLGEKLKASQELLRLGIELTAVSRETAEIANEARAALETNGFMTSQPAVGPTWLEVVDAHQQDIYDLERRYTDAVQKRETLDVENLPGRALNTLASLDQMLDKAAGIHDEYFHLFPLLDSAFGADSEARYLILLQNGQELRGAGGFPGTYALITVSNGRISQLEIKPIGELNAAYVNARDTVLPAPGPIREYLGQQEWFPHDANWSADFPQVADELSAMYADTGWPPLNGIVAVNDSVVQAVLQIIGPYEINVQDTTQTVSADTFLDLIQSYRGQGDMHHRHKEVVAILGDSLITKVREADFDTKKTVFFTLRDMADQREIQVAMLDPEMQAEVTNRGWDGALDPLPGEPTLIVTISNVTGNKASNDIQVDANLELMPDADGDGTLARWTITQTHTGDPDGVKDFHGFHRSWTQVYLPENATLLSTSREPAPPEITGDPRALGFNIGVVPGTQETLTIEFELPASAHSLLLRRQSGLHNIDYTITGQTAAGCSLSEDLHLDYDYLVDFDGCEVGVFGRE